MLSVFLSPLALRITRLLAAVLLSGIACVVLHGQSNYATPYTFTTLAGSVLSPGSADGTGSAARFGSTAGLAIDSAGNLYVTDSTYHTVRKITPAGVVTTIAGVAGTAGSVDGAGGTALFNSPRGIAVDASDNVYVSERFGHTIRKITFGVGGSVAVSTLAGLAGVAGSQDGTGSAARFRAPAGLAVDGAGNVYVTELFSSAIRKITPEGAVSTFAGVTDSTGSTDGTGTAARFNRPVGLAVDGAGNIYVSDVYGRVLRKITSSGVVTTVVGSSSYLGSTDGTGPAATMDSVDLGLAADGAGNVYVAQSGYHLIRKISPGAVVTTLAGLSATSGSADGTGVVARFFGPSGLAVNGAGVLYVADSGNNTIRKGVPPVSPTISTQPLSQTTTKGSTITFVSTLSFPSATFQWQRNGVDIVGATSSSYTIASVGLADAAVYRVKVVTAAGPAISDAALLTVNAAPVVSRQTLSHTVAAGYPATFEVLVSAYPEPTYQWRKDGVNISGATEYAYTIPSVVEDDAAEYSVAITNAIGTTYSDPATLTIDDPLAIATFAGSASVDGWADGTGGAAHFSGPRDVATDASGNVYVVDWNQTVRKITPDGLATTLAGLADSPGASDGPGGMARFNDPNGLTVDSAGNVYVADTGNNSIRKITAGGLVTTLAGSLLGASGSDDGSGTTARFSGPLDVAVDSAGNLFVTDAQNATIRKISPDGVVATFAGKVAISASVDGTRSEARFEHPSGLAVDASDNIYVSDSFSQTIRKITPAGAVTTLAGAVDSTGWAEGTGDAAHFSYPTGIAVDAFGNVYVGELPGTIRKITPAGAVFTVAGITGDVRGSADGIGSASRFFYPSGIAVGSNGDVFIADMGNHTIRKGVSSPGSNLVASSKVLGDFNGDGKADLVWTNSVTGERSMWFLNGNSQSSGASLGVVPVEWVVSATADFDGDGKGDIFWTNTVTGDRAVWLMNGSTRLTNAFMGTVPVDWVISGTGDFNGDGKADLVWTNTTSGDRAMWLLNGSTVLGGGYLGTVPVAWVISGVGDFNGDGKADLVWTNTVTGERSMWFQNGSTTTGGATLNTVPPSWAIAGVGDFNGDGKADIFLTNTTSGDRVIWLMNGSTITTNAFMGTVPVEWSVSGTGDFNGDGRKDLFWTNTANGDRAMWLLNGSTVTGGGFMGTVAVIWTVNN